MMVALMFSTDAVLSMLHDSHDCMTVLLRDNLTVLTG